jgi:XTP/dITP diphosphohydrolase
MKLVIASNNQKKLLEIRQCLPANFEVFSLNDLNIDVEIEETGQTFQENAAIKAKAIFEICKLPVLADDSGLEVEALNGAPGIYSARFAGEPKNDEANNTKLLKLLENHLNRKALFICVLALYNGIELQFFEGIVNGKIAVVESGSQGFGYDPLFIPDGFSNTFAELSKEIKNTISHRAKAIQLFSEFVNQNSKFL